MTVSATGGTGIHLKGVHCLMKTNNNFELRKTEDGSYTLYSSGHGDTMHSIHGAYDEAVKKHVQASRLFSQTNITDPVILDMGFGMGFNSLAALHRCLDTPHCSSLTIHAFEKDIAIGELLSVELIPEELGNLYTHIINLYKSKKLDLTINNKQLSLHLHTGDIRHLLPYFEVTCDAVFHDPYTPSKNPEMWTVEIFTYLYQVMEKDAILTTYSSAPQVRGALLEAGFHLGSAPSTGKKKEGTIASPGPFIGMFSQEQVGLLKENNKSTPYRDPGFQNSSEKILQNRLDEIKIKKGRQ